MSAVSRTQIDADLQRLAALRADAERHLADKCHEVDVGDELLLSRAKQVKLRKKK